MKDYIKLLQTQLQQKENIIKEVREYIEENKKEYGSLEDNESFIEGAEREFFEETGYKVKATGIVDILNVMEAHIALMDLENVRIVKEMRNSVNRKVNCETANLNKTVSAAVKQIEDIKYIRDTVGLEVLSPVLKDMAIVRLENPETPLKELGTLLSPSVGKSGVNHRLRKISEIAEGLRK